MAAEIGAVDLGCASLAADTQRLHGGRHGLTQFVRQNKRRLVLHIEVPAEGEHALAFDFVAKQRDGHQVDFQRQLAPGEQGPRGYREIRATRFASPARLAVRAPTVVTNQAAAVRTDRFAVGLRPAQAKEHVLGATVGHPHDFARVERASRRG
jgi:hypothetical protein